MNYILKEKMDPNLIMDSKNYLNLNFLLYKYKYLYKYIYIGFFSVVIELIVLNFLVNNYNLNFLISDLIGLVAGIIFAFILNFYLNFKLNLSYLRKTFLFFMMISILSWSMQKILQSNIVTFSNSYELNRLVTSSVFFLAAYYLHRRFTFKNYKKVGFALYLTKKINYEKIFKKVLYSPDFIHLDVVDKSFSPISSRSDFKQISKIKKYWPNMEIHTHIMSKEPMKYLDTLCKYSTMIYVHYEIKENLNKLRKIIKKSGKKFGIAITLKTNPKKIVKILRKTDGILILSIDKPGHSGQEFRTKALEYMEFINKLKFKEKLTLCIDGGINEKINKIIDSDYVVSNSSILKSVNPNQQIFKLKSNSYYEL